MAQHPGLDYEAIDEIIFGCANQAGEDNRNVARMSALLAGLPVNVPGTTINRLCGSGMDATITGARAIISGEADLVITGGVESISRAPVCRRQRHHFPDRWKYMTRPSDGGSSTSSCKSSMVSIPCRKRQRMSPTTSRSVATIRTRSLCAHKIRQPMLRRAAASLGKSRRSADSPEEGACSCRRYGRAPTCHDDRCSGQTQTHRPAGRHCDGGECVRRQRWSRRYSPCIPMRCRKIWLNPHRSYSRRCDGRCATTDYGHRASTHLQESFPGSSWHAAGTV